MTYQEWLERFSNLSAKDRAELRRETDGLAYRPLISVLLPVYNPDLKFLGEAIESVRRQIYQHWELCLADDASTDPRVRPFLKEQAQSDPRLRLIFRDKNGHISACSNSALTLVRGEWCALLDQDDLVAENALAAVALEIDRHPDASVIYSDEDFVDAAGARSNPFFKPDWSPELFLAQNYLNHLGVYRSALLREIGGFREGFEGSQDYDLALRCVARSDARQIRHIPHLLYHWRTLPGSLAKKPDAKPYARHAARRALNSYLNERGIAARAEACPQNEESHRVIYEVPRPLPKVTLITTTMDDAHEGFSFPTLEIIRAPAGSTAMNAAATRAKGEVLIFLHRTIEATEIGWLEEIVSHVVRPEVGAVGARLWSARGQLEDGGLILGLNGLAAPPFQGLPREHPGYFNRAWLQQNYSAVSGACLALRQKVFVQAGGFDVRNLPHHFYDIDLCLRLGEQNLQVVWTPYANLTLAGREALRAKPMAEEVNYMQRRWGERLSRDPFYNPNLSLEPPGFVLAIPPRC
ncbi:MAG TPA: glycosyltransferase [Chthoniobacterales bacterium]